MGSVRGFRAPASVLLLRWARDPFGLLDEGRARFGDVFTVRFPHLPSALTILADPQAVKDVFALGPDEGHAGKGGRAILRPLLGAHSLTLLDGKEHLRHRKMMLPAFHGERMQAYGATMLLLAHDAIDRLPLMRAFSMKGVTQDITLQVILRTVFGVEQGPRFAELAGLLTSLLDAGARPILFLPGLQRDYGPSSPWGRFLALLRRTDAILREEIRGGRDGTARDRARSNGTSARAGVRVRTDVLAMMLEARDEAGAGLTEDELEGELLTLLVAGHETTATALAWALRWILPDRGLLGRLREEIASAGGEPSKLAKLELLEATVKEALRLQPVVPNVARVLQKPARLGDRDYPAGAIVAPSIYLMHRRASLYPEPERFLPDRFLGFKPSAWEWLPFGGGLRRCIGAAFALYEMKMVLAALLPRVEMRLADANVTPVRRGVTIAPSKGLEVVVTAKRSREALTARGRCDSNTSTGGHGELGR